MKQRLLAPARSLITSSKRSFQYFGGKQYLSGFDRMLVDKLKWVPALNGNFFALFGLLNLGLYGLSLFATKEQYRYHFGYDGMVSRLFSPIKAMAASDQLANVLWTAPSLIGFNLYLNGKVPALSLTKFFALSMMSTFMFWSAFNPQTGWNYRPLKHFPGKFDAFADDGSYFRGADQLAQSIIYFTLIYHRMWLITGASMAFDLLYYGPATLGGPLGAITGSFMFL